MYIIIYRLLVFIYYIDFLYTIALILHQKLYHLQNAPKRYFDVEEKSSEQKEQDVEVYNIKVNPDVRTFLLQTHTNYFLKCKQNVDIT